MRSPEGADRRWGDDIPPLESAPPGWSGRKRWLLLAVLLIGAAVAGFTLVPRGQLAERTGERESRQQAESRESLPSEGSSATASPSAPLSVKDLIAEAGQVASQLVATFPNRPEAHLLMGRVHRGFGSSAKGVECWEKAIGLDPNCGEAYYLIGKVAAERGDYAKAVACFREAVARAPRVSMVQFDLGESLMLWGKTKEAVDVLERATLLDPESPFGLFLLGQGYLQLKNAEKARGAFEGAIAKAQQYADASSNRFCIKSYYGLARAWSELGQTEKASQCTEKFLALKSQGRAALLSQPRTDASLVRRVVARYCVAAGTLYAAQGRTRLAEKHWLRAAELDPRNAASRTMLERLYRQENRTEEAIRIARQMKQIEKTLEEELLEEPVHGSEASR